MEKVAIQEVSKNLKYDGSLNISVAESRTSVSWRNKTTTWSDLLAKFSAPTKTHETIAEYKKAPKSRQAEIKDVGGFVGGFLKNGRRKADHVQSRSFLTLDADSAPKSLWDDIQLMADFAVAVYTTHSHTGRTPRYRFIVPLNRVVQVEEYEPLARKWVQNFGINLDYFDDTTYQAERLMYWPSHAKDAEFLFDYLDLPFLDPDKLLAEYEDWKDSSFWPVSSRVSEVHKKQADKQGDPLEKKGVIGAFNRTYAPITAAIEQLLPDVYAPTNHDDRWTYVEGSTSGGLVIYDDKFAYSHHGTDPVGMQLVNAFDLVRIHKFGDLDEDIDPKTNVTKYPSYQAMQEFATELPEVKKTLVSEKLDQANEDFDVWDDDAEGEDSELNTDWLEELDVKKNGQILGNAKNLELIFRNDLGLKGTVGLDDFAKRITVNKDLPWRKVTKETRFWSDTDDAGVRVYLEKRYGIVAKGKIDDALTLEMERNKVNPVRDYLDSVEWDGVKRLEKLLVDYQGAEDTQYVRTVTRKFMTAAVARIYHPGTRFDSMLVLSGPQGIGKSTLPSKLAGNWFSNSLDDIRGKDAYEAIQGVWIMEMGEMNATRKADIEATKNFITKTEDSFRVAYGRHKSYFPRTCVFWGTTNDGEFLHDRTGNRRFWPVDVGVKDHDKHPWDLTKEDVNLLWAEAKHYYLEGEALYLSGEDLALAEEAQAKHTEEDTMVGEIEDYLEIPITEDWYTRSKEDRGRYISEYRAEGQLNEAGGVKRDRISVAEVLYELYNVDTLRTHPKQKSNIRQVLGHLDGWEKYKGNSKGLLRVGPGYGTQVVYVCR